MSKTLGNGIDPLDIINQYGADSLKFTLAYLSSQSQDLPLDSESFALGSKFCNKIWNASRYLLMNSEEIVYDSNKNQLNDLDRWIYSRLNHTVKVVDKAMQEYRFDDMTHAVYDYFWNDFCDWYIEGSKLSLYNQDKIEQSRAFTVALNILEESLRLLHPFVPFITEEIYQKLPNTKAKGFAESIMIAKYPQYQAERENAALAANFTMLQSIITASRTLRSENKIPPEKKIRLAILLDNKANKTFISQFNELIKALVKASEVNFINNPNEAEQAVSLVAQNCTVFTFVRDFIDINAEKTRVTKELAKWQALKESCSAKLANKGFTAKAPATAIEKEHTKLQEAETALTKLTAYLQTLN